MILRDDASWIVAGWASRNAAEIVRRFLTESECQGVLERLTDMDLYPGSLADFASASPADMRRLHRAVVQGFAAAEAEGPSGWHEPEFFPGFLARFRELVELIAADPRVRHHAEPGAAADGGGM